MTDELSISGARYVAESLRLYGVTHVFYVDAILRKQSATYPRGG